MGAEPSYPIVDFHNHHINARWRPTTAVGAAPDQRARWDVINRLLADEAALLADIEAVATGNTYYGHSQTSAIINLAESLQGLIHHMRTEQQMIRDWVDAQAEQNRDIRKLLELLVRETHKM